VWEQEFAELPDRESGFITPTAQRSTINFTTFPFFLSIMGFLVFSSGIECRHRFRERFARLVLVCAAPLALNRSYLRIFTEAWRIRSVKKGGVFLRLGWGYGQFECSREPDRRRAVRRACSLAHFEKPRRDRFVAYEGFSIISSHGGTGDLAWSQKKCEL